MARVEAEYPKEHTRHTKPPVTHFNGKGLRRAPRLYSRGQVPPLPLQDSILLRTGVLGKLKEQGTSPLTGLLTAAPFAIADPDSSFSKLKEHTARVFDDLSLLDSGHQRFIVASLPG